MVAVELPAAYLQLFRGVVEPESVAVPPFRYTRFAGLTDPRLHRLFSIIVDPRVTTLVYPQHKALYPVIVYVPQAIGLRLSELITDRAAIHWYGAALGNLVAGVALTYWALRLIPCRRWTLCLLALTPMSVSQRSGTSADVMTTAIAWVAIAVFARFVLEPDRFHTWGGAAGLLAVAILLASTKQGYVALAGLLLLPLTRDRRRATTALALGAFAAACVASVLWLLAAGNRWQPPEFPGTNAVAQLGFVRAHLPYFGHLLLREVTRNGLEYYREFFADTGWLTVLMPQWTVTASLIVFVAFLILDHDRAARFTPLDRLGMAGLVLVICGYIGLGEYLYVTPVGAASILGIQGRLFSPVAPLLALAVTAPVSMPGRERSLACLAYGFCVTTLAINLVASYAQYFGL